MISVVIPIYNTSPAHFKECVDSILDQTLSNFEVLVVDNGSREEYFREYEQICKDSRIHLHKIERIEGMKNLSRAVNYGIKFSKFDFVARMDADDVMVKDRLEKQVNECNFDVFKAINEDGRDEGIIDDIRDLRRYLFLVEAEMVLRSNGRKQK